MAHPTKSHWVTSQLRSPRARLAGKHPWDQSYWFRLPLQPQLRSPARFPRLARSIGRGEG